eukprot:766390-Hanusia_phi.AAC.2
MVRRKATVLSCEEVGGPPRKVYASSKVGHSHMKVGWIVQASEDRETCALSHRTGSLRSAETQCRHCQQRILRVLQCQVQQQMGEVDPAFHHRGTSFEPTGVDHDHVGSQRCLCDRISKFRPSVSVDDRSRAADSMFRCRNTNKSVLSFSCYHSSCAEPRRYGDDAENKLARVDHCEPWILPSILRVILLPVQVLISPPPLDAATWDANKGGVGSGQRELVRAEMYARGFVASEEDRRALI